MEPSAGTEQAISSPPSTPPVKPAIVASLAPAVPPTDTTATTTPGSTSSPPDDGLNSSPLRPATAGTMVHAKRALSPLTPLSISSSPLRPPQPLALPRFLTLDKQAIVKKFIGINIFERDLRYLENNDGEHLCQDRYSDVKPWDHNRIMLPDIPGLSWTYQYINASPISLGRPNEGFIATQGPPNSETGATQFWRMVWQERVEIVIMLTKVEEAGREKCGVYWPEAEGDTKLLKVGEDDDIRAIRVAKMMNRCPADYKSPPKPAREPWGSVECTSIHNLAGCEVRVLKLVKRIRVGAEEDFNGVADTTSGLLVGSGAHMYREETRTVHHFYFKGWPDHDVPKTAEDRDALLQLVEKTRFRIEQFEEDSANENGVRLQPPGPRLVHCSAGVGRTGTFIALDYFLRELEEGKLDRYASEPQADPVFEVVKQMRRQRTLMVQKVTQYALIYQVLKDKWEERAARLSNEAGQHQQDEGNLESPLKKRKVWQERI